MTYLLHLNHTKDTYTLWPPGNGSMLAIAHFVDSGYDASADMDGSWTSDDGETEWYAPIGALKYATHHLPDREDIWAFLDRSFSNHNSSPYGR